VQGIEVSNVLNEEVRGSFSPSKPFRVANLVNMKYILFSNMCYSKDRLEIGGEMLLVFLCQNFHQISVDWLKGTSEHLRGNNAFPHET
jgi:hypothetical protein